MLCEGDSVKGQSNRGRPHPPGMWGKLVQAVQKTLIGYQVPVLPSHRLSEEILLCYIYPYPAPRTMKAGKIRLSRGMTLLQL